MQEEVINIFEESPIVYATFWERFAATLIDSLIVGALFAVLAFLMTDSFVEPAMITSLLRVAIAATYAAVLNSSTKQGTYGKQAMNIKVTDTNGERISLLNAIGRFFAAYLSMLILLIGYLMMLWSDKKQCLHDMIANTLVLKY
ncbi:MAG: RDD family protein [Chitinophagaceae bacterium]|nr:RDD family protein [Chitinophagaceae bacterium]